MKPALLVGPAIGEEPTTLVTWLLGASADERPWLVFHRSGQQEVLRFCDAEPLARRWAAALEGAGVAKGDRVAVFFPNGVDFIGAFLGAQWLGAAAVPVPWPATALVSDLPDSALRLLDACRPKVVCASRPIDGHLVLHAPAATPCGAAPVAGPVAFLQYSSGSTGRPRGAVISPTAAACSAVAMVQALELNALDVGVSWLPFFHDMGLVGVVLTSLAARYPVHVLQPGEFLLRPSRWLELASAVRATMTVAPNFAYELVLRRVKPSESHDLSAMRAMLNGSEPVHRATLERFERCWSSVGLRAGAVLPVYGLAENVLGVTFQPLGAPDPDLRLDARVVPSAGRPLAGVSVAIRDEAGSVLPEGREGDLWVRSPMLMAGYFEDEASTASALRDGWLRTGDRGVVQHERLYLTGREKELVIKLGRKFHPSDIERIVAEVADPPPNGVMAFSVEGTGARQEALVVVVEQRREPQAGLVERIRGRVSAELGVLVDRVELVGAGALPRTTSGKLQRREALGRFGGATP